MKYCNPVSDTRNELNELILSALGNAVASGDLPNEPIPSFQIEIPADTKNGDFATNVAMVSARAFKLPPKKIAEIITTHIYLDGSSFERIEIAGPGFINLFVNHKWFETVIRAVGKLGEDYGKTDFGNNKKVLVEFVSANPTGPMHIGNARGGAVGDGIASVLDWAGFNVSREFYVNDAGNQINRFAISLEARYLQLFDPTVTVPEDAYQGDDITTHAKNFAEIHGEAYVKSSSEERKEALVAFALPLNIKGLEQDLLKYRIKYDSWFLESTLHKSGEVEKVIELLKEKGHTYENDGATWFKATDFGDEKDFVLVRSNGVPTYVVPDIAYHYNKFVTRGFDKAVIVLGADHHGYVPRLKAAVSAMDIDQSRLDVVLMQMVNLLRDGETIKASKRSGKSITLVTLLEEVPIDAARFFFNMREANSHLDFDLDLAVAESSQNPVYYVQYAHARICSILQNLKAEGVEIIPLSECKLELLSASEEIELMRHIAVLPSEIIEAAKGYEPSRMTRYATDQATLFHKFYNSCRVKCEDKELMQARVALCVSAKLVIANVLKLLKIDTPSVM